MASHNISNGHRIDIIIAVVFLVIAFVSHRHWFDLSSNLFFHDWRYRPNEVAVQILNFGMGPWLSFSGLGSQNIQLYAYGSTLLWGIIGNYNIATKFTHFLPIALLSLFAPYFFIKDIFKSRSVSFFVALLYGFNTYLITRSFAHLPIAVVNALCPLIFLYFRRFILRGTILDTVSFVLLYWVGCIYEVRIMYVVTIALIFYAVVHLSELWSLVCRKIELVVFVCSSLILLNLFWLIPTVMVGSEAVNAVANRGLWGGELVSMLNAIAISDWNWTLGEYVTLFVRKPVLSYLWIFPLLAFSAVVFKPRTPSIFRRKDIIFASILSLVGIFLSKQEAAPFPAFYGWMYRSFPGFNLFREATKFYLLVVLGYSILASWTACHVFNMVKSRKKYGYVLVLFLLIVPVINAGRLVINTPKATYLPRIDKEEYRDLDSLLRKDDAVYFRTLWIPVAHQWGFFSLYRPRISMWDELLQNPGLLTFVGSEASLKNFSNPDFYINTFKSSYGQELLSTLSVKYIIVPKELPLSEENIFPRAGSRQRYVEALSTVPYLQHIKTGEIDVFKNESHRDPVFLFSDIISLESFKELDLKFSLLRKENRKLNLLESTTLGSAGSLLRLFESTSVSGGRIEQRVLKMVKTSHAFYRSKSAKVVEVKLSAYFPSIQISDPILLANGVKLPQGGSIAIPDSVFRRGAYIEYAEQLYATTGFLDRILGRAGAPATLYRKGDGLVINSSFEQGSWQKTVGDCNKFDNNPILGMSLNRQEKTDGRQSLQLEATRHTACISTKIALPADSSGDYALSFDYQSPNGQKAGYYLQFDDEKKTVVRETPSIATTTWQSYAKKISIPAGAKNARLYLYGYSLDEQTNVITRYDNVQFGKLELVKTIDIPQEEGYEKIPVTLKEGENTFEYVDPRYDYKNLLPNPSFETRPWQEKVGDCNRYDDNPQLAMRLNEQEKTDGAKSLELEATRHTACMATTIPIKPGATYQLSFDYQSPNAKQASYYIGFNDPEKTSLKDQLTVTSTAWQSFSDTFTAPKGATSLSLYVYARETDKKTAIINRYDNVKLIEVPDLRDAFYLVSEPERKLVEPKAVAFELINPTKKLVHIKGATTPFFLGMSESHHDQWQLQFQNDKIEGVLKRWWPFAKPDRIADEYHYKLNGFLNAWYIDTDDWCATQGKCTKNADGSYDIEMVIEFWPQRWFYLGLLISGTTLAGCLSYLGYEGVKSLRCRLSNRKKELV